MMGFLTSAGSGDIVFLGTIHPQTLSLGFWKTASFIGFRFRRHTGRLFPWSSGARASLGVILQATGLLLPRKALVAVV